jgi:pre-mRNA-splicing factor CWC22
VQEKTYARHFGLIGQRLCMITKRYQDAFSESFHQQYQIIHRLETNKLRNVAKFFGHLLMTDALPWTVFEIIRLNQEETTSSSRIFIKILCLVGGARVASASVRGLL